MIGLRMPLRLLPLAIGPAILLPLAVYAFRHRRVRGAIGYTALLLAIALWSAAYAWELAAPDFGEKLLALQIKYIGVTALPVAWIGFVLDFVARERAAVRRATRQMAVVMALMLLAAWTNGWHGLFWGRLTLEPSGTLYTFTGRGPIFYLNIAYTYTVLFAGLAILVTQAVQSPYLYRKRTFILVTATVIPWLGNVIFISRIEGAGTIDATPFLFTCTAVMAAVAVFRYRVLDPIPTLLDARIEVIGDGLLIVDRSLRVADLNRAAEAIIGRDRAAAAGEQVERVLPDWPPRIDGDARKDVTLPSADGARVYDMRITPIEAGGERLTGYVVLLRDVTEHRRLEEDLRQAQKMESVGKLAGGIAHDFNNLLTAIIGYAALAEGEVSRGSTLHEWIEQIRRSGEQAATLTSQLLAFGRRQTLRPVDLDLNAVVDDIQKMLGRLIGEQIELVVELSPALERVRADRSQVEQVLVNLVVNARDAMPRGGRLTIRTQNTDGGAAVSVEDTGEGIAPELLDRIFEPFFTTKPLGRGTGLGLATVYGIVKQSGGDVQVESVPARGSRFTVLLPAAASQPQPAAAPTGDVLTRDSAEPASSTATGASVLIVEDDPGVRAFTVQVLRDAGSHVFEANNAAEALAIAAIETRPIDLLLTDVVLPGIDGADLAARLRGLRPGLRVLFMSGYTPEEIAVTAALGSEDQLLRKPFLPAALRERVAQALAQASGIGT
jgi:signal transduction histidine kinase/ActR/RegA family two-component response regulator